MKTYISVDEALERIRREISAVTAMKEVAVRESRGEVLANSIAAVHDVPRFDKSAMDGYVFARGDLEQGRTEFPVAYEIRPEDDDVPGLEAGTCARIMTGARIPEGGTQVVPVEMTDEQDEQVLVKDVPKRNPIRPKGEGYTKGQQLLPAGGVVRPYEMGLMTESGHSSCLIRMPITVALQVTGSEIDEKNDTNGPVLEELMSMWPGVQVDGWPVLGDDLGKVSKRLRELRKVADIIVTTGGISAGKHDYLFQTMNELGATCLIRKVAQKPGKPFTLFMWDDIPVCHLPGNPVSAVFTAECYAREVIAQMLGLKTHTFQAATERELSNHREKTLFVTARTHEEDGSMYVDAEERMRSHLLQTYTGQNAYARIPPETRYEPGDLVECLPFSTEHWLKP